MELMVEFWAKFPVLRRIMGKTEAFSTVFCMVSVPSRADGAKVSCRS